MMKLDYESQRATPPHHSRQADRSRKRGAILIGLLSMGGMLWASMTFMETINSPSEGHPGNQAIWLMAMSLIGFATAWFLFRDDPQFDEVGRADDESEANESEQR